MSRPPPLVVVFRETVSGVDCGVPYDGLTHGDLAGGEVADAEGSQRVVRFDAENDALHSAWRQLARVWATLAVIIDRAVVSGVSGYFMSARRRALISRRPVSGCRERKTSVFWPKRGQMVAAAG